MNLHEYQGKSILASHGVTVQRGVVVDNAADAMEKAIVLWSLAEATTVPSSAEFVGFSSTSAEKPAAEMTTAGSSLGSEPGTGESSSLQLNKSPNIDA